MKKIFAILLTLLLIFALAACGDNGENPNDDPLNRDDGTTEQGGQENPGTQGGENNNGGDTSDIDIGSIIGGATDTVWGKQDEATKQAIIDSAKADGYDVTFGADGSMTVVDPTTGETMIQNPDGSWTFSDDEGSGQLGGNWPDNEFTKLLPKPDFPILAANTTEDDFSVAFQNVTVEQIRDYVEKIKAKGFTVNAEIADQEVMGIVAYSYQAENADGYAVTVTFTGGTSGVVIEKP